jgi:SH3 domain-containing YSC84-like protein 1
VEFFLNVLAQSTPKSGPPYLGTKSNVKVELMKKIFAYALAFALLAMPLQANDKKERDRLENCGTVLQEIMDIPDDIPQDLIDKADCIIIYPSVVKAAFIFGASYGRGSMTCRTGEKFNGPWSAPTMMALEGGSFGFQIGGQATDFVLLVMNERGARSILKSKVKLGADASAAAGPKGRNAEASTDVTLRAEILSYSRARGLFAGVSLAGSTVRPDNNANSALYHKDVSAEDIIFKGAVPVPPSAQKMISYLNKKTPKNQSSGKEI